MFKQLPTEPVITLNIPFLISEYNFTMRGNPPKNYVIWFSTVNIRKKQIILSTAKAMNGLTDRITQHALYNLEVNSSIWTFQDIELSTISRRNLVV